MLVGALGVAGDPLEVLLDLGVVVDLEVIRRVDVPLEVVVLDAVLVVVRHERRLRAGGDRAGDKDEGRRWRCRAALGNRASCACACVHLEWSRCYCELRRLPQCSGPRQTVPRSRGTQATCPQPGLETVRGIAAAARLGASASCPRRGTAVSSAGSIRRSALQSGINPPGAGVLILRRLRASHMAFPRGSGRAPVDAAPESGGDVFAQAALAHIDSLYGTALRLTRRAAGRRGPGAGHVSEGVSVRASVRAGHEPQGVAVHDPPQHVPEHAPSRRPEPGGRGQRGGRAGGRRGPASTVAGADPDARDARRRPAGGAGRAARGLPPGGLAARRRGVVVRGNARRCWTCRSAR